MSDSERITIPAETTVAVLALLVGIVTLNYLPVGGFYDDGLYAILAKSLATGQGYRFLNLPGAPAAVHYPPGYPMLLALFWKLAPSFPANLVWLKLINVVLLAVIAWEACRYAVRVLLLSPWVAVLATLLGTMTIPILALNNMLLSEPFFLTLLIPALILGEEMARHRPSRREALWLGFLSGAVVLVRSVGVMLIVAVAAVWLARRAWRAAAWYLGASLLVWSPWLLWSSLHAQDVPPLLQGSYGGYAGWFMGGVRAGGLPFVIATVRVNATRLAAGVTTSFQALGSNAGAWIALIAVLLALGGGAWRVRRRAPVTLLFLALYFALVLAWPDQPLRFAWGVWPLLMALLVVPLEALQHPETARPVRAVVAAAALVLAAGAARYNARGYANAWWESIPRGMTGRAERAIEWARLHTRRGAVIAGESEPMLYLYAQREAVPVETFTALQYLRPRTTAQNADDLRQILQFSSARYVLVRSPGELDAARALAATPGAAPALSLVDSAGGLFVFAVKTAPPPVSPPNDSAAGR
ncbi:MAG: hypothetical protein KGL38_09285 [Gemmatimonadota bacterium]|nr:hypothetical protein [Gemmatimonadota bacterium]MDE3128190.1 hypothetical protein [Gemmatimonadota bacterium]MDE3173561.1 hypothetical protein [Gemmatimonadota bacterium]MDE3217343.1 hypothetical protein [Gemmatimonadota bacterium]